MKLGILKATKLRNLIKEAGGGLNLDFHLRNDKYPDNGCRGFIVNKDTGRIVYVTTDPGPYGPLKGRAMYREAADLKDWSGGVNRWGEVETGEYVEGIVRLLQS